MKKTLLLISFACISIFGIGLARFNVHAATPVGQTFDVDLVSHFGVGNDVSGGATAQAYGSKLSLDPTSVDYSDYAFAFWIVNGVVCKNLPINYQFTVTENLSLEAVFKPTGYFAVVFMDSNGKSLSVQYVATGGSATAPVDGLPTKPGYDIASTPWVGSYSNVTEDVAVILQYTLTSAATFAATVTGGVADKETYANNEVATLTANAPGEGLVFSHWAIGTRVVSTESTYKVTMLENIYINAVFLVSGSEIANTPRVYISDPLSLRSGYESFRGQFYVPSGYELIEYGLLVSSVSLPSFLIDTEGITRQKSEKYNATTNEFVMSFPAANVMIARAYLIVKNGSEITVWYSDISNANGETLILHEVYGGGGNSGATYKNDFITIYNATSKPINLNGYSVQYASTTGTSWTVTPLTNVTLQPYSFYLIKEAAGTGGTVDLPTADATGTILMSATGGKVALVNSTTAITGGDPSTSPSVVDYMGWGAANYFEGTKVAATTNTTSVQRRYNGYDTDNNVNDYIVAAPQPKNSTSVPW